MQLMRPFGGRQVVERGGDKPTNPIEDHTNAKQTNRRPNIKQCKTWVESSQSHVKSSSQVEASQVKW